MTPLDNTRRRFSLTLRRSGVLLAVAAALQFRLGFSQRS
jgi:hypothetical protein